VRWVALWVVGTVMLIVGWYLAAGDATFQAQIAPTDLAVAGAVVVSMANVLWILRGRRVIGERMHRLLAPLAEISAIRARSLELQSMLPTDSAILVAGIGMEHFHRSTCPMAAGREWPPLSGADLEISDRIPCGVCRPTA
jgi:hypothetical protein